MDKQLILLDTLENLTFEKYVFLCDELLLINKRDLVSELSDQSKRHGYWTGIYAEAKKRKTKVEDALSVYVSKEKKDFRLANRGAIKKLTASDLQAHAESTKKYTQLKEDLTEACYKVDLVKGLLDSMSQRHGMLIQLSANNREEAKLING